MKSITPFRAAARPDHEMPLRPTQGPLEEECKAALEAAEPPADLPRPTPSPNALAVLERRYLRRDEDTDQIVETPAQLYWRVASHVATGELAFEGDLYERALELARSSYSLMALGRFLPNSPTLTNSGRASGMLSACFVLPVEDSIEGIFESIKATAMIQKAGGGTGFSFSRLRPSGDEVSGSTGNTVGPVPFMEVFSKASASIRQGSFRQGANMGVLRIDHPDVLEFISSKEEAGRLTNYNISVAVTEAYLDALRSDPAQPHEVVNPRTGATSTLARPDGGVWTVGQIWELIVRSAHSTGEPGLVFIDRINAADPVQNVGRIEATNPCGEQPLHAYDSCNLGSLNLAAFIDMDGGEPRFDEDALRAAAHTATRFLDDVIEVNRYPLAQIEIMSRRTRRIGLGVMGYGDALFRLGLAYDSEEGLDFGENVMRIVQEESHAASEQLAEERGTFLAWSGSRWAEEGRRMRNSYTTTVAPTGTISILADCSGGIEPLFSLVFERRVMSDEQGQPTLLREVNPVFEAAARDAGYWTEELAEQLLESGTLQGIDGVPEEHRRIFVTARDISPEWHVRTQAAFQEHCDASISKTINFPAEATVDEVRSIFRRAIDLGVKGLTVYRDGSRRQQPMALEPRQASATGGPVEAEAEPGELTPVRLPEIMSSLRIRQLTPFGNMHVKVSVDPRDGREREVFAQLGKGGDLANSDLEAICRLISLWLRAGGGLGPVLKQLSGIGSSLTVPTKDGRIMSLADGVAIALRRYLEAKQRHGLEALLLGRVDPRELEAPNLGEHARPMDGEQRYRLRCPGCDAELAFEEGCTTCRSCGFSQC